jgi:hypothetical protein
MADTAYRPGSRMPSPGTPIVTADGKQIGRVKECDAGHFRVAVRWARDYWLSDEVIRQQGESRIELAIQHDLVPGYKLRRTGRGFEPVVGGANGGAAGEPPTDFAGR